MKRFSHQLTTGPTLILLGLCLAMTPLANAADSDLSISHTVADPVSPGTPITVTTEYGNAGPDTATSAYINSYFINMGGPELLMEVINQEGPGYEAIQATADGTDTNGNVTPLFSDDFYCQFLFFQAQGDNGEPDAIPMAPIPSGATGSFTYQAVIPTESANTGTVEITEPADLADAWTLTNPANIFTVQAGPLKKYGSTTCAEGVFPDEDICAHMEDNCWGDRIAYLETPIEAEFELVDDGTANPTYGCADFQGFTPGNIAVLRRGSCEFGEKGLNAQFAGASAVFMVNSTQCGGLTGQPPNPDSEECVLNLGPGAVGALVTIPMIQVSYGDGEPVIAALESGTTVRGVFGTASKFNANGYTFLAETTDEDPNPDNDTSSTTVDVSTTSNPPVAAFTYSPAEPTTGQTVMFMDASTGGPTSWAWDFDDGATSTEQNPSHAFSSAGTFTVSLTATNAGGSSSASMDVVVTLGAALTETYFIPAAALAAGAEGSFFQTDVDINSNSSDEASYAFLWLPRNTDNSTPVQSDTYNIGAGESVRYENVLADVFGAEPDVAGALAVISNTANLNIMSRTYAVSAANPAGTFGQALPGVPADQLIMQNETKRITFMSENNDLRANLGCVNGVNDSVRIVASLYDDAGTLLETRNMDLAPWSNNQFNRLFQDYAPTNGYVDVTASKAGAAFYCYGSVLDNGSNDPTSILPTEYGADTPFVTYFVPAAALAAGAEGSFFQTDVDINNAGSAMATYQFLWLPRGADNSTPVTSDSFTLAAGAGIRYENVLSEVFGAEPDVAGALAVTSDSAFLGIMSRTYAVSAADPAGTFGQAIPGIPASNLIMQSETKRIIFMSENDALRANLGCVNGVNDSVRIVASLYDDAGTLLETRNMDLGPWSNNQFNRLFQDYAPTNGYVDVTASKAGAAYYCYGSVLDNGSNDPTTILPQ